MYVPTLIREYTHDSVWYERRKTPDEESGRRTQRQRGHTSGRGRTRDLVNVSLGRERITTPDSYRTEWVVDKYLVGNIEGIKQITWLVGAV